MRTRSQVILVTVVVALTPVAAQEANDRYRTVPTDGGFLEIENQTGAVRECTRGATGYQCKPASPEALQPALDRLARENAELRERLARRVKRPPQDRRARLLLRRCPPMKRSTEHLASWRSYFDDS